MNVKVLLKASWKLVIRNLLQRVKPGSSFMEKIQVCMLPFTFTFSFGVDYVQRWGRPSIAAQYATPT